MIIQVICQRLDLFKTEAKYNHEFAISNEQTNRTDTISLFCPFRASSRTTFIKPATPDKVYIRKDVIVALPSRLSKPCT